MLSSYKSKGLIVFLIVLLTLQTVEALTVRSSGDSITVGSSLRVFGSGFSPDSSVWIYINEKVVEIVKASKTGNLSATVRVPDVPCGYNAVWAVDDVGNKDGASFYVTPRIEVTPKRVQAGSNVTITGRGFSSNAVVLLELLEKPRSYGLEGILRKSVKTDEKGYFEVNLEIPATLSGYYLIDVSDLRCRETVSTKLEVYQPIPKTPKPTPTPKLTPEPSQLEKEETIGITPQLTPKIAPKTKSTPGFELLVALGSIVLVLLIRRR